MSFLLLLYQMSNFCYFCLRTYCLLCMHSSWFVQYVYLIKTQFAWASGDDSTDYELMHPEHLVRNSHLTVICIKLWCLSCNLKYIWTVILKMWDTASGESGLAPVHQGSILNLIAWGDKPPKPVSCRVECWAGKNNPRNLSQPCGVLGRRE